MSQERLAEEMRARGWPWRQQTVTRVENGRRMVRLGEATAVAEILETPLTRLTWETSDSLIVETLGAWGRKAISAYRAIAEATRELLQATELLRTHPSVADTDPAAPDQLLQAVEHARKVQQLTPEGAVAQGIAQAAPYAAPRWDGTLDQLRVFQPQEVADAGSIAAALRTGEIVVVDLSAAPKHQGQRIHDYVSGAARVRGGSVRRVGDSRYVVLPATPNAGERTLTGIPDPHAGIPVFRETGV